MRDLMCTRHRRHAALALIALLLLALGTPSPTGPMAAALALRWRATQR